MHTDEQIYVSPILPKTRIDEYLQIEKQYSGSSSKIILKPLLLETSSNKFRNFLNPRIFFHDLRLFLSLLRESQPDDIFCLYLIDAFPFVLFKIFFSYSISVFVIGGDINLHPGSFHKLLRKIIFSNCKNIFSVSSEINTKIYNETGKNSIITPNGVDSLIFRPLNDKQALREHYDIDEDCLVILTVCNLLKEKGVDLILQSLKIYLNNNKNSILLIRGTGPEKNRLQSLVKELGLEEHVFFLEQKTIMEMIELYNMSDIFILASYSEGLPSTVLESMASGCITIASSVGEVPKVICDGENGFLIEPGDVESIARKMLHISSMSEEELRNMKDKAREKALNDYDINIITKKMFKTISSN